MKEKKFRLRPRYLIVAALLLLLLLRGAVGKYVQTIQHTGTVTFTASLAEKVVLQEHEAKRKENGSYTLTGQIIPYEDANGDKVIGNSYTLIPGLDIPKDPHIVITGKTDIPAYLYIEIVDGLAEFGTDENKVKPVTYLVSSQWITPTGQASKNPEHGGTVYVYSKDGSTPFEFTSTPEREIYILANNEVIVGQHLKCDEDTRTNAGLITIYAYLVEALATDVNS